MGGGGRETKCNHWEAPGRGESFFCSLLLFIIPPGWVGGGVRPSVNIWRRQGGVNHFLDLYCSLFILLGGREGAFDGVYTFLGGRPGCIIFLIFIALYLSSWVVGGASSSECVQLSVVAVS